MVETTSSKLPASHTKDVTSPLNYWKPIRRDQTPRTDFAFDPVEDALRAFEEGQPLVVMDDENRENEGDIIMSASKCTTEIMAWIIKHTSGYICIALPGSRLDKLAIPMMFPDNQERHRTAYTVTVDYKHDTTTGISANDRALTARKLCDLTASAADFNRPGHLVPLRAHDEGVLERKGHTESGVDLCMLTGQPLGGVLCELVNDDEMGTMARRDDCRAFADKWGLKMISVEMLAEYRRRNSANGAKINGIT
ncbi:3,4-dihydroxy-2-butanone 4-phosphate synthase-domain-containing protein [Hygrophoropsis aurantiaca]|uniref:3,4-dihydroxy-2-butanone 4-phosphate synthase-domain-containing protein n=1 Tax=Hygrophoropsis aurantiaca TaxID=72124 RepID=A0ACB8AKG3_9AGAM|nr:3,4-dihydroxy-2-butanone 4-phosphate synthase-domain-containing protein [Hygrophoropsis aurantiaca]